MERRRTVSKGAKEWPVKMRLEVRTCKKRGTLAVEIEGVWCRAHVNLHQYHFSRRGVLMRRRAQGNFFYVPVSGLQLHVGCATGEDRFPKTCPWFGRTKKWSLQFFWAHNKIPPPWLTWSEKRRTVNLLYSVRGAHAERRRTGPLIRRFNEILYLKLCARLLQPDHFKSLSYAPVKAVPA